jgi:hypothetical protein
MAEGGATIRRGDSAVVDVRWVFSVQDIAPIVGPLEEVILSQTWHRSVTETTGMKIPEEPEVPCF